MTRSLLLLSRVAFDQRCAARARIERREGLLLAIVSVGLGLAQLAAIRWLDARLDRDRAVAIEGAFFIGYIALVGWLLWRMQSRIRAARVTCPACHVALHGMSERVAAATGNCDACGGRILEESA